MSVDKDRPSCYNRPAFRSKITVQHGWNIDNKRHMITIDDPMSKGCQQWGPLGEASIHKWNCAGCNWLPKGAA